MSDSLAILREPLKGDFEWLPQHQEAFEKLLSVLRDPECCYVHLASPDLPIWARCDSSTRRTSGQAFQTQVVDGKVLGPFVLCYSYKSWNAIPNFVNLTANLRELTGLLWFVRQLATDYPSHPHKRIIATDSIIIGLLSYAAKHNSSLADDRLFFTQLENTEICWTSNLDLGLRAVDWYTRIDEGFRSWNIS